MSDIVLDFGAETIAYMVKYERFALIDMVKRSWLPARVMRNVFDACREEAGLLKHLATLSTSHPDSEVRAMGVEELLAFVPVTELGQHLWA